MHFTHVLPCFFHMMLPSSRTVVPYRRPVPSSRTVGPKKVCWQGLCDGVSVEGALWQVALWQLLCGRCSLAVALGQVLWQVLSGRLICGSCSVPVGVFGMCKNHPPFNLPPSVTLKKASWFSHPSDFEQITIQKRITPSVTIASFWRDTPSSSSRAFKK